MPDSFLSGYTPADLLWGLIFSSVGVGYFLYGKKRPSAVPLVCGIVLMIYPCFIVNAWVMFAMGVVLMAIPYFLRR